MKISRAKLFKIASLVREKCRAFAFSKEASEYDFYREDTLICMCAVASYTLKLALDKEGIKSKFISGHHLNAVHCWLEVDKWLVDITASQFCMPDVYIINKNKAYKENYTKRRLMNEFYVLRWGKRQRPNEELSKKILEMD